MNAFESHHDNKSLCCCCLMFWRWKEGVRDLNAADILFLAVLVSCKPTVDCSLQSHRKSFFFKSKTELTDKGRDDWYACRSYTKS